MDAAASRSRARDHQPCAASDRLQHRRHGGRSAKPSPQSEVIKYLRRRLSRLHPHRRVRSHDVARRVPEQQGSGAGGARPLQRGPERACSARSAGATATRCSTCSPAPAPSAAASSMPARIPPRRTSAAIPTRTNSLDTAASAGPAGSSPTIDHAVLEAEHRAHATALVD